MSEVVIFNGPINLTNNEREPYYTELSFTKESDWVYENEIRLISKISDCKYDKKNNRFYQKIEKEDVKEIFIGMNCKLKKNMKSIVQNYAGATNIYKMLINTEEYKFEKNRVTREFTL